MGADMPWPQRLAWLQQQLRLVQEQVRACRGSFVAGVTFLGFLLSCGSLCLAE